MAAEGSITVTLELGGPMTAAILAALTGWVLVQPPTSEQGNAMFARYVGTRRPSGEQQRAHIDAFEAAVAASNWKAQRIANGIVVDGTTNPLAATALLLSAESDEALHALRAGSVPPFSRDGVAFVGTCFAFRHTNIFVTARHCVEGRGRLFVLPPGRAPDGSIPQVESVIRHDLGDGW